MFCPKRGVVLQQTVNFKRKTRGRGFCCGTPRWFYFQFRTWLSSVTMRRTGCKKQGKVSAGLTTSRDLFDLGLRATWARNISDRYISRRWCVQNERARTPVVAISFDTHFLSVSNENTYRKWVSKEYSQTNPSYYWVFISISFHPVRWKSDKTTGLLKFNQLPPTYLPDYLPQNSACVIFNSSL